MKLKYNFPIKTLFVFFLITIVFSACSQTLQPSNTEVLETSVPTTIDPTQTISPTATNVRFEDLPTSPSGHIRYEDGTFAEYLYRSPIQVPWGMVTGPDGLIYIADYIGKRVIKISENDELIDLKIWQTNPGIWDEDGPMNVAFDSNGTLHIGTHNKIYRIDENNKAVALENINGNPIGGITFGPDGLLYYTNRQNHGGVHRWEDGKSTFVTGGIILAQELVFGLDGTLYVSQMNDGSVVQVDVATGTVTPFASGGLGRDPIYLTVDQEGDIWMRGINSLYQVAPDGIEKKYSVLNKSYVQWFTAADIAFDGKGRLWVASYNSIIMLLEPSSSNPDPSEFIISYPLPSVQITDIVENPDGDLIIYNEAMQEIWKLNPNDPSSYTVLNSFDSNGSGTVAINEQGRVFIGMPWGQIVYLDEDNNFAHYANLTTRNMRFGKDGNLYAIIGDYNQAITVVRLTGEDTYEVVTNKFDGENINGDAFLIQSPDEGFYIFGVESRNLYDLSFNGETRFITDFKDLGGNGPAALAIAPDNTMYYIPHGPYILYRINLEGERSKMLGHITGDPYGMVVSEDGNWLYIGESGAIDKIWIGD